MVKRCKQCIWQNDSGECENKIGKLIDSAPYWQKHPDLEPIFASEGIKGDDCIGFEAIPSKNDLGKFGRKRLINTPPGGSMIRPEMVSEEEGLRRVRFLR